MGFGSAKKPAYHAENRGGLLAELADAMDSKSIARTTKTPVNIDESAAGSGVLRSACAGDATAEELATVWPRLTAKQRKQLITLAKSMVD